MDENLPEPMSARETVLQVSALAVVGITTLLSMWTLIGPCRWLVQIQIALLGGYSVAITIVVTFMALWTPVVFVISRCTGTSTTVEGDASQHASASLAGKGLTALVRCAVWIYQWVFCTLPGLAMLIGIGLIVGHVYLNHRAAQMEHLVEIDIAALEAGSDPESLWLAVTGAPLPDAAIAVRARRTSYYVPIASSESPPNGVAVFARFAERSFPMGMLPDKVRWQGVVEGSGLPAVAKLEFEKIGLLPAANYRVLNVGATPTKIRDSADGMLKIGGVLASSGAALLAIWYFVSRNRYGAAPDPE